MSDNPNANNTESSSAETENTEHMIPKSRFDEINSKYKDAMERLEKLEQVSSQQQQEAEAARQKELAEQNRYKELYEQAQQEIEKLKSVQAEAKRYRESFETTLASRMEQVPEDKRHLVPEYDDPVKTMAWLDKALPDLTTPQKPNPPNLNGGSGNSVGQRSGTTLTQDEIAFATSAGIPLDAYAAAKAQRGKPINLDKQE